MWLWVVSVVMLLLGVAACRVRQVAVLLSRLPVVFALGRSFVVFALCLKALRLLR